MPDTTPQQDPGERAAILLEKRLHAGLTADEQAELDRLAEADPSLRDDLASAQEEHQAMLDAASRLADRFDFDAARRAITNRAQLDRHLLRTFIPTFIIFVPVSILVMWPNLDWLLLVSTWIIMFAPFAAWMLYQARRRRALRAAMERGDDALLDAYTAHLKRQRNEFVLLQGGLIIVSLAAAIAVIDLLAKGGYWAASLIALLLVLIVHTGLRHAWTPAARRRHERFIQGRATVDELLEGRDAE